MTWKDDIGKMNALSNLSPILGFLMIAMLRFKAFSIIRFLVLGSVFLFSPLHAQDLQQWKPNVGDRFECLISHNINCGDYECTGIDTVLFEITDTAYDGDTQHPDAVFATTSAIGLHLTYYEWGQGYDSIGQIGHNYNVNTLISSPSAQTLETSFNGASVNYNSWMEIPFIRDTSIVFQGVNYQGSLSAAGMFLPKLGWFFSLTGNEYGNICYPCLEGTWTMALIAASGPSGVQVDIPSNSMVFSEGSFLQLVNIEANKIMLMDLVGRIVNAWQFPSFGHRDITLNVADVQSGVYFLQISAPGVEEMRKVVIVH